MSEEIKDQISSEEPGQETEKAQPALEQEQPADSPEKLKEENSALEPAGEESAQEDGVTVAYHLSKEEIEPALYLFQKQVIFKRNTIYTVILGIILAIYFISVILDPAYAQGFFLVGICAVVIGFLWYLPYRHRKSTAAAIAEVEDTFYLTFFDDHVMVGQGENAYRLKYREDQIKATEFQDILMVTVGKERIFVVPNRCVEPEIMEQAKEKLAAALGENFSHQSGLTVAQARKSGKRLGKTAEQKGGKNSGR